MVAIMCTGRLMKAVVDGGLRRTATRRPRSGGPERLGSWAAAIVDEGDFAVAVNEPTYLTLVVRLMPVASFRERFVDCLRAALLDLGVSEDAVAIECAALREAPFVPLRNPELSDALAFAEMEAGAHLEGGQDEISVRDMLNTYPYGEGAASCAVKAVPNLFGVSRG